VLKRLPPTRLGWGV